MDPEKNSEQEVNSVEPVTSEATGESSVTKEETTNDGSAQHTGQEASSDQDISEFKTMAVVGYILPFLFFIPLQDDKSKNVPFVRFHANQQLVLLVTIIAVYILNNILFMMFLPSLMWFGVLIVPIIQIAILALAILGAVNAYQGKMKELPFIGQFRILK